VTLIDLFCGCGGFSLGAHNAGFEVAAAFDNDAVLTSSFRYNFPQTQLFLRDVSQLDGEEIKRLVGRSITGVFGGPPCQGFSDIGRRDINDPRRQLVWHFFRIVAKIRPAFFVMENVRGLAYSNSRDELRQAMDQINNDYDIFGPEILDAAEFGAATRRRRLFVIGTRKHLGVNIKKMDLSLFQKPPSTVRFAIQDLGDARPVKSMKGDFDVWQLRSRSQISEYAKSMRANDQLITGHRKVEHRDDVARRFSAVPPGSLDLIGRHPKLLWDGQCPTLRAGTGPDKGSRQAVRPLHPEEPRVITVREAARLQGFPDKHLFHPTTWHSFRMIGNSVSPIIAEAVFRMIRAKLGVYTPTTIAAE
jgi:DNA (cytosine-5)-methyltransferase 1